ncbi:MAG: DUF1145 domain-containing protein [Enterobacteriaceae bacterium]
MGIVLGKALMLVVWCVLLLNLLSPFPKPLMYFMHIALIFMVITHGLQMLLFKASMKAQHTMTFRQQCSLFLFGVFELLVWRKKWMSDSSR